MLKILQHCNANKAVIWFPSKYIIYILVQQEKGVYKLRVVLLLYCIVGNIELLL